jgi:arabinan endo-1,5-alpha-L-arabinosidase
MGFVLAACADSLVQEDDSGNDEEVPEGPTYANPVLNQDFPDPTVIAAPDGWYYAYGTETMINAQRYNIQLTEIAQPEEWYTIAARHRYWKLDERDAGDSANPELDYETLYPEDILELNRASESVAIEAPFIFKKGDYYYLFISWDRCCRGVNSTYKVLVGRSKDIKGPYVDKEGENLVHGGGSLVVRGFEESERWAAGGHNSAYTFDGMDYLVFHAYDKTDEGHSKLVVKEIGWDDFGWPTVSLKE